MGEAFLDRLSRGIYEVLGDSVSKAAIIFPNMRPAEYLYYGLAKVIDKPLQPPACFSIDDFVLSHSSLKPADNLQLVLKLYGIYSKYYPQESFDKFYQWGQLLLKDYDEIDRYMVDAP